MALQVENLKMIGKFLQPPRAWSLYEVGIPSIRQLTGVKKLIQFE